jgi:alpha-beta hydrolase superfamily lysophospholipase
VPEEPFDFTGDGGPRLSGTFVRPQESDAVPAALIISGSGPLDRDSNMPGQTLDNSRTLASHLSQHGIASLRYDKRGVAASPGDYLRTGFDEETRDAQHAVDALRGAAGVDPRRVCVIGHSVGAAIAIRLAAARDWLAAAVLLSGAAVSGLEVMRQQSERIAATMPWWQRPRRFLRTQERERDRLLESRGDVITLGGQELPARWFREYMHYDPAPDLRRVACPLLAIIGRSDVQVDPGDVERIRSGVHCEFTGHTPEHLTHLLRIDPGPPGLRTYAAQMRRPMDAGTLEVISAWLGHRLGRAADSPIALG